VRLGPSFNGAAAKSSGKSGSLRAPRREDGRFNGAAAKSSGKSTIHASTGPIRIASMGPPLKAAENMSTKGLVVFSSIMLQWGRR